ncbi:hypothetical protein O0L34_g19143 [Tuta absoluta]|nr:hypothetical protein O0L34_g19143 [Tuta absoluta]
MLCTSHGNALRSADKSFTCLSSSRLITEIEGFEVPKVDDIVDVSTAATFSLRRLSMTLSASVARSSSFVSGPEHARIAHTHPGIRESHRFLRVSPPAPEFRARSFILASSCDGR